MRGARSGKEGEFEGEGAFGVQDMSPMGGRASY